MSRHPAAGGRRVFERYLTEPEERALLRTLARVDCPLAKRDLSWIRLLRHTGIRLGTLCGLTLADAREALRTEHLRVRDAIAKGGRGYTVFLVKAAQRAIRDALDLRRAMGLPLQDDAPLYGSRRGGPLSPRSAQLRLTAWAAEAGLRPGVSPHWLRHTLAKRVMARSTARDPRGVVQVALGQSDARATQVYTLPDLEEVQASLREAAA